VILLIFVVGVAVVSGATKSKLNPGNQKRDLGIGSYNSHPEVLTVGHGHGHGGGGGGGHGGGHNGYALGGFGGGGGGGWGEGATSSYGHGEYPALADIVALVLNLLVLAAFGGLVYLLLSPLLSGGHDDGNGWGRATATSSPYYDTFKDGGLLSKVINSIDYVDTTFAVMKISGDGCRKRVACEMEKASNKNKIFNYATNFFRNRMRSMDLYRDAMTSGDKDEDCTTAYPDCTYTLVDKVGKWVGQ